MQSNYYQQRYLVRLSVSKQEQVVISIHNLEPRQGHPQTFHAVGVKPFEIAPSQFAYFVNSTHAMQLKYNEKPTQVNFFLYQHMPDHFHILFAQLN
jgi:hypothetical protein